MKSPPGWETSESLTPQWVACERYRNQSVSVTRIVVRGFSLATHWERSIVRGVVV